MPGSGRPPTQVAASTVSRAARQMRMFQLAPPIELKLICAPSSW
jgi:hypothetical protein